MVMNIDALKERLNYSLHRNDVHQLVHFFSMQPKVMFEEVRIRRS